MQKVINVLAVLSFLGTAGIIGGGAFVYLRRDAIAESVKERIAKSSSRGNRWRTSWNDGCCNA